MKKTIKIIFLCAVLIMILSTVCIATDVDLNSNELTLVTENPLTSSFEDTTNSPLYKDGDLYLFDSEDITMSNYVNGNAFIIGPNVTISGTIDGDLFVMAKNSLTIDSSAKITGNIFALTDNFELNGITRDIYALCTNFKLGSNGYIYRDLKLYSNDITIEGLVGKDANFYTNSITFPEGAKNLIGGNLTYSSKEELEIPQECVKDSIEFNQIKTNTPTSSEIISNYISSFISILLYAIVVILLIAFITPNFSSKLTYCINKKYFASAGIGILAFIFVPILAIFLMVTGFLTFVGIALFVLYFLILSITISILGIAIGNYFVDKFKNKTKGKFILLSILSVAVLWGLQQIPTLGGFVSIFTIVFGIGIFIRSLFVKQIKE